MHGHVESNCKRASEIRQIYHCGNDNNFKVKVIQHEKDSNCAITRKFCVMKQHVLICHWKEDKGLIERKQL
jgi:hypothetical protein